MSRTLKAAAVVIAVVAASLLVFGGTVYALGGDYCASGDSSCGQQHRAGCIGSGRCPGPGDSTGAPNCNAGDQP
jgi:hypothetical protein